MANAQQPLGVFGHFELEFRKFATRVVPSWSLSLIHSRARDIVYLPCQVVGSVRVTGSVSMFATTWARLSCLPSGVESECHSPTVRLSVVNEQDLQIIGLFQEMR